MTAVPTTLDERFRAAAAASGDLDVAYDVLDDTPVGPLLVGVSDRGLCRVSFDPEPEAELERLAKDFGPRVLRTPRSLDRVRRELDEYFAGRRHRFDVDLDWQLSAGFRQTVLRHLTDVEYGHTASYATVARLSGRPAAVRAVGTACATNPLPVVVPCHRVIKADGSLGGYLGGADAKATLLELERSGSHS